MDILASQFDAFLHDASLVSPLVALVLAFFGGILASLTPCVYPMIPITAGVIAHANLGGSKWRGFVLSLIYVIGMALTYAALGIFAAATGSLFGTINSSPWTFLVVGIIMLFFGLTMLDVLNLPMFSNQGTTRRLGASGIFIAGVSSALVAGPCTTPILGSLLAYIASSQQGLVAGGLLLFVFSMGMGVLLLGVGTFSSILAALPRSGAWMMIIKRTMGTLMLSLALYFFIKAALLLF